MFSSDHIRIWKQKNIFSKRYKPNWTEILKVEEKEAYTHVIEELNDEEIVCTFDKKERQKKTLRVCNGKRDKKLINCPLNGKVMIIH